MEGHLLSNSAATAAVRDGGDENRRHSESDDSPDGVIDSEEIAKLAHSYWLARSGEEGSAEQDWFRAEEELRRRPRQTGAEESSL
jgi:hypothetical protein